MRNNHFVQLLKGVLCIGLWVFGACSNPKSIENQEEEKKEYWILSDSLSICKRMQNHDKGLQIYQLLRERAGKKPYYKDKLLSIYCSGSELYLLQNEGIKKARLLVDSALNLIEENTSPDYKQLAYQSKASIYEMEEVLDSAVYYVQMAYEFALKSKHKNSSDLAHLEQKIGVLYTKQGNYEMAIKHLKESNRIANTANSKHDLFYNYMNISNALMNLKPMDTNLYLNYIDSAYQICLNDTKNSFPISYVFLAKGEYYAIIKPIPDSGILYINKYLEYAHKSQNREIEASILSYIYLSECYTAKKDQLLSKAMLQKARDIADPEKAMSSETALKYYNAQYRYERLFGTAQSSLATLEKIVAVEKKMKHDETYRQLLNYEKQLKILNNDKKIALKQFEIEKQKGWLIFSICISVVLFILMLSFYNYWRKKKQIAEQKNQILLAQSEIEKNEVLLKGQIEERNRIGRELHDDIGSAVTMISMANNAMKNKGYKWEFEKELEIIGNSTQAIMLSLNEIVWSLNNQNDSLFSLVSYAHRFASKFLEAAAISLAYKETLPDNDISISTTVRRNLYLCIKELLNNLVKHSKATRATLSFEFKNDKALHIQLKDNGMGIKHTKNDTNLGGNGLTNIRETIEHLGGQMNIESDEHGTIIELKLSLAT